MCVFVIMDLGQWHEGSGTTGKTSESGFLFYDTKNSFMTLYVDCLEKQTDSSPVKTKHSLASRHDTSVTKITSAALVARKDDIPVGILNSCAHTRFKSFPV